MTTGRPPVERKMRVMPEKKKIRIMPGGPYEVDPSIPMNNAVIVPDESGVSEAWAKGKREYPAQDAPYYLCRCGRSKNKPFCDGAHVHAEFHDHETAKDIPYDQGAKRYPGDTVDLLDDEEFCAVAKFCDRGESVWAYATASGQPGFEAEAIKQACNCPSGRLTIQRKNGEKIEPDLPQEISPVQDTAAGTRGPLWVKGGIELTGQGGHVYETRNRMTLCRCGESGNMPFCDASHLRCEHMRGSDET